MSAVDTLFFDDFDSVASPAGPTGASFDGFFFDDIGMPLVSPPEMGYVGGGRYTWSGGAQPMGLLQTVRAAGKLYLGFFSRFDQAFDTNDALMIWLKPAAGSPRDQIRRIEIFPVQAALGATGSGGAPSGPFNIYSNAVPIDTNVWKGFTDPGDPDVMWAPCGQAIAAKVRSWAFGGSGGVGWSVEVEIPVVAGADWITLGSSFRLMTQMIRQHDVDGSTTYSVLQFPRLPKFAGFLDGNTADIPADSFFGTANVGLGASEGVRFQNASYAAIGRLKAGGVISQSMSRTHNLLVARVENLSPSFNAPDVTAEFRFGKYGIPPGGTTNQWHDWRQPVGMAAHTQPPKRTAPQTLPIKTGAVPPSVDLTADWPLSAADADFANPPNQHRCMVAILHSTSDVNFSQASIRANTNFYEASEVEADVEVSGEGYEEPADGSGEHEFVLLSFTRLIRGPDALEADPDFALASESALFIQGLLDQVIPEPHDGKERITGPLARATAQLRWFPGEIEPKVATIELARENRRDDRSDAKRRVRVLGPTGFASEAFKWEPIDVAAVVGQPIEFRVAPADKPGESARHAVLTWQVLEAVGDTREGWEVVDTGTIALAQSSRTGLKPGISPKDALVEAQALLLVTFALRRTGMMTTVGGVTGEVLDETPGEFALAALHQGLDDVFGWSLSGPALQWISPGLSTVRVPHGGAVQLDLRLAAGPKEREKQGDLGPRYVQADPLELEWKADDTRERRVTFTHARKGAPSEVLFLELAEPAADSQDDFVWKGVRTRLPHGASAETVVRPPRSNSPMFRYCEIPYRVTDGRDGGEGILETGRIRLSKLGARRRKPDDRPTHDRPGRPGIFGHVLDILRRLFR